MNKAISAFLVLCLFLGIAAAVYVVYIDYSTNRTETLSGQVRVLSMENSELRRQLIEKNNEQLLYEAAERDNKTVNMIAQWQVFAPIVILVGIACILIALLFAGAAWIVVYNKYYAPAINRAKK